VDKISQLTYSTTDSTQSDRRIHWQLKKHTNVVCVLVDNSKSEAGC